MGNGIRVTLAGLAIASVGMFGDDIGRLISHAPISHQPGSRSLPSISPLLSISPHPSRFRRSTSRRSRFRRSSRTGRTTSARRTPTR
jgi:hypothetical protein